MPTQTNDTLKIALCTLASLGGKAARHLPGRCGHMLTAISRMAVEEVLDPDSRAGRVATYGLSAISLAVGVFAYVLMMGKAARDAAFAAEFGMGITGPGIVLFNTLICLMVGVLLFVLTSLLAGFVIVGVREMSVSVRETCAVSLAGWKSQWAECATKVRQRP